MGFRCQAGEPHLPTCVAYRAAHAADTGEDAAFPICSECGQTVHEVQPRGLCDPCAWRTA